MSKFPRNTHYEVVDGKDYFIDAALVPALRHVPREMLPPLLAALDREHRTRHKAWMRANARTAAWRSRWADQAIPLVLRGKSYANIGKILESKGLGSADRISRTLAKVVVRRKK